MSQAFLTATYLVDTDNPQEALNAICRGQSVGNPDILTPYETKDFLDTWAATGKFWREGGDTYVMLVKFPQRNAGAEGINYLLSVLLGGQCDIDIIRGCRLMSVDLGYQRHHFKPPRFGITGLRKQLRIPHRAFVGGIIKPKIGLTPKQLAEVVHQMADGGCDFIKEDEILADQFWCPMSQRLPLVAKALEGYPVVYLACVTGDGSEAWRKARRAQQLGATGVHLNVWCGLGTYQDVRQHIKIPIHFQKSGDKVWTTGPFSIEPSVLYQFVNLVGCDTAHVGMYGGYMAEEIKELRKRITALGTTLPTFSCGLTPELAKRIIQQFGTNLAVFSGGWIHGGHSVTERCQELRRAVDEASQVVSV